MEYGKPWLSIAEQIDKLQDRGVVVASTAHAAALLRAVGYYRLTGYLYPFRESERVEHGDGTVRVRIHNRYRPGTSLEHAASLIDFDRSLRLLVLDGVERIEVSLRMQLGYQLGKVSPFAHLDQASFVESFTEISTDPDTGTPTSKHAEWLSRVQARQDSSDEAFVAHFRDKYDGRMPIWALTEILEMGHIARLYAGLNRNLASEIAEAYAVPSKKIMTSWMASVNYVRNVAAHHARLFNRKLVSAPARPRPGQVPLLDHLRDETTAKSVFGVYNALAVIAYLLGAIEQRDSWVADLKRLMEQFPARDNFDTTALGMPRGWRDLEIWQ
ncbi:Abi family protein [Agromyces sp. M3QZ16-3]|uniref:Abi family protein n=1 Tax=Agromyces sp. M3QZ16-3 TaxID=3447585 RepID=UPI003F68BF44